MSTSSSTHLVRPKILDFYFQYVSELHINWYTFEQLFGDKDNVKKLNRRTGVIFGRFQIVMREQILIGIAKLFDNAKVCGKITASFAQAIEEAGIDTADPKLIELTAKFAEIKKLCQPIIKYRHKTGAHLDRAIAMGNKLAPQISRALVGKTIEEIGKFVNQMERIYSDTEVAFNFVGKGSLVPMLFRVLDAGNAKMDADKEKRTKALEILSSGKLPDGFDPSKISLATFLKRFD